MEIKLKIKDVKGMTDDGRHILQIDEEEMRRCLIERKDWLVQCIFKEMLLRKEKRLVADMLENTELANTIYTREKNRRDRKFREQMNKSEKFFVNLLNNYDKNYNMEVKS